MLQLIPSYLKPSVNMNMMEYNYHNFARVPCRKRLRVQSNNRRVRASTPLVSRGTRWKCWDPRIFECSRPRVNARVPPHRFDPPPLSSIFAPRYFRLFRVRYGAQIKVEKVIWQPDVHRCVASARSSIAQRSSFFIHLIDLIYVGTLFLCHLI